MIINKPQIGELWMQVRDRKKLATILAIQEKTHRDVAHAAGWKSHSIVGRIIRGEVTTVEPERALRIAEYLGVPVDDLFIVRVTTQPVQADHARSVAS